MNAYEYLSQTFMLDQQIKSKISQIESLKSLATSAASCCGNREPIVKRTRNVTALEDTILKIIEAEKELDAQIDALVDLKLEISRTIAQVKDVTLRLILERRYLAFDTWKSIGDDMGYTERWLQFRHNAALEVVQGILDRAENGGK